MPGMKAQVRIPRDSGLPEDVSVNTLHWSWDAIAEPDPAVAGQQIVDKLSTFYSAFDQYLSNQNSNPVEVRVYRMDDPEPRAPVLVADLTPLSYGIGAYPSEVAITLSFQGVKISGENQARRRGRIFIGPLADIGLSESGSELRVSSVIRTAIGDAAADLATILPGEDVAWTIYSPSNDNMVLVTDGWVDNAFDTMRSRGARPTARTLWSA